MGSDAKHHPRHPHPTITTHHKEEGRAHLPLRIPVFDVQLVPRVNDGPPHILLAREDEGPHAAEGGGGARHLKEPGEWWWVGWGGAVGGWAGGLGW